MFRYCKGFPFWSPQKDESFSNLYKSEVEVDVDVDVSTGWEGEDIGEETEWIGDDQYGSGKEEAPEDVGCTSDGYPRVMQSEEAWEESDHADGIKVEE